MFKQLKFISSFFLAFLRRFNLILILGVLFGVLSFLLVRFLVIKLYPTDITYIGVVGKFRTDELPGEILEKLSEGLTTVNKNGLPQPGLAKSWEATDGGKIWKFTLDENKHWQDGSSVSSNDLQYSFEDVTIDRPDTKTLIFNLKSPYAPFPTVLSRPVFKKGLLGTGSITVTKISQVGSYVEKLELTDLYGHKDLYRFYPTEEAAKVGYELGQVDILQNMSDVKPLDNWNSINLEPNVEDLRYVAVFFNNQEGIFKDNKTLRQALAYAIQKEGWVNARALGPIPSLSWAYNPQVKPYEYDKERAQELIKPLIKKDQPLKIKLSTVSSLLGVADQIAKDWEQVGVFVETAAVTEIPENFEALLVEYDVSLDPDQYLTWHSTQSQTNISHYANPRIDKLLEDGRLEMDFEKRKKIYLDFQRFLLEDVPAVFLYHPLSYTVSRK